MGRLEPPRRRHHGLPTDSLLHQPNEAIAPTPATRSRLSLRSIFSVTICVALALAAPVIAAARDAEERADARAILAKWNSQGPRRSDGCPMSCGMARDAFASGYCENGACKCLPGWTGDSCTQTDGEPPIPDSGCDPRCGTGVFWATGTCKDGVCKCIDGWTGTFCGLNPAYPLHGGALANLPKTRTKAVKENGANTITVQPTNGCPYYPVSNGQPMRCGPDNGNLRCPDGLCCSSYGYCGGNLRSFVPVASKSSKKKRWETADGDEAVMVEREDESLVNQRFFDFELPTETTPTLEKRGNGAEPVSIVELGSPSERHYCWGARSYIPATDPIYVFKRSEWEKRNCAKLSLEKRDFMCGESGACCTSRNCARMALEKRLQVCLRKKKRNNSGSGCCTTTDIPPCPTTPPQAYCDAGCQPNFGKCAMSTASCTGVVTATATQATGIIVITTTTTGAPATLGTQSTTTTGAQPINTGSSTTTVSGATGSPTPSPGPTNATDIFNTLFQIVNGQIQKPYKVDKILSAINLAPLVKAILSGQNPAFPNVTFFAVTNDGSTDLNTTSRRIPRNVNEWHVLEKRQTTEPTAQQFPGDVLRYDIVQAYLDPATLPGKVLAPTLLNSSFTLAKVDPQYMVVTKSDAGIFPYFGYSNSTVIDTIPCTNGIIFVVSKLVIPPVWPVTTMNQANLTSFAELVEKEGLTSTLNGYGRPGQPGATFFVPVNEAFITDNETIASLDNDQLKSTVNNHIVISGNGAYYSSDLTNGLVLTSVFGETLNISVTDGSVTVNGNNALILDILTSNGVIHVIDGILFPDAVLNAAVRSGRGARPRINPEAVRAWAARSGLDKKAVKIKQVTSGIFNAKPVKKPGDTSGLYDASAGGDS